MIWGLSRDCTIEFFLPPWNSNTTSRLHQTSLFYDTLQLLSFNNFAKQKNNLYLHFSWSFPFFFRNEFIFSFFFFSKFVARVPNFFARGKIECISVISKAPTPGAISDGPTDRPADHQKAEPRRQRRRRRRPKRSAGEKRFATKTERRGDGALQGSKKKSACCNGDCNGGWVLQ